jgi:hypothetical protein
MFFSSELVTGARLRPGSDPTRQLHHARRPVPGDDRHAHAAFSSCGAWPWT